MIPRSPVPLLVACALACFAQSHASTIDDLMGALQSPYLDDTVYGIGHSETLPRYEFRWMVGSRDAQGRPLVASYTEYPNLAPDSALEYILDYTWGQPVDIPFRTWATEYLPNCLGCTVWPSRMRTRFTRKGAVFDWDNLMAWDPYSRSMVVSRVGVGSTRFQEGPCPWSDSLVFDKSDRPVLQVRCRDSRTTDPARALRTSMRLHYDNATDTRPRSTSEESEDTSVAIDSARYEGPAATPTRLFLYHREAGASGLPAAATRIDSLVWDHDGNLQARIIGTDATPAGKSLLAENYNWVSGRLESATTGIYPPSNPWLASIVLNSWSFGYRVQLISVRRRAIESPTLRRSSNGRFVIPCRNTRQVQVEWTGVDGRRQDLTVAPEGDQAVSVRTPRGVGILRVTQDGRTTVHPVANF